MELDKYLEALKKCPDEFVEIDGDKGKRKVHRLTYEFGIYDNWPILLNADFEDVIKYLSESDKYEPEDTIETDGTRRLFNYIWEPVKLQVFNKISPMQTTGSGFNDTKRDKIESDRQLKNYKIAIVLHPYQDGEIKDVQALAKVVVDIGEFITGKKIPACMPNAIGWKHLNAKNTYSKIVYHEIQEDSF